MHNIPFYKCILHRWAAKAGYYQSFTTPTLTKIASDYFSELSANSTTQTETISLDLSDRLVLTPLKQCGLRLYIMVYLFI